MSYNYYLEKLEMALINSCTKDNIKKTNKSLHPTYLSWVSSDTTLLATIHLQQKQV